MGSTKIQLRRKGTITLPQAMRRQHNLSEGDVFTLVDLGDGAFLLTPGVSQVAHLTDEVARILASTDVTVDELLQALDLERESYYQDRYASPPPIPG